jgi:hypothetical protein
MRIIPIIVMRIIPMTAWAISRPSPREGSRIYPRGLSIISGSNEPQIQRGRIYLVLKCS